MIKTTISQQWNGKDVKIQGKKVVGQTIFGVGLVVERQAKLLCAVDYGYLAASITTQSQDQGTELETPKPATGKEHTFPHDVASFRKIEKPSQDLETLVGTAVDYGPYPEFGTINQDAQPFLRPALDLAKGKVLTVTKGVVNGREQNYFADYLLRPV